MDKLLFDLLDEEFPKFNETFCNGLTVSHMARVEPYINNVIKCAEAGFPKGLRYEYAARATAKEAFDFAARNNTFELAESNLYLMKYYFSFEGEMLPPKYIYLPYVSEAGMITIRGARFQISPILTDKTFSVGTDSLFIPFNRAKLTFERILHHYVQNGTTVSTYIIWSTIYNRSQKNIRINGKPAIGAKHTLMHYLLCAYGLRQTFALFAGTEVVVGYDETVNATTHPDTHWIICKPTGLKPHGLKDKYYMESKIRLAVPASNYNPLLSTMIGAFFYIVDHFPNRITPEVIDDPEEIYTWRALLGHLIWGSNVSEGKLVEDADAHMESLNEYVDDMKRETLREDGIYCNDIYQLFMYVMEHMSDMILKNSADIGSMYGKQLTVLRYVLSNIIESIFQFTWKVRSTAKKQLTAKDISNALMKIRADEIMQINRGHGEVSTVSYPGDNKLIKITSKIVLQANSAGRSNTANGSLNDQSLLLHSSILEVGSIVCLPKSDPTGRSVGNPHLQCDESGNIQQNPDLIDIINNVQRNITR